MSIEQEDDAQSSKDGRTRNIEHRMTEEPVMGGAQAGKKAEARKEDKGH